MSLAEPKRIVAGLRIQKAARIPDSKEAAADSSDGNSNRIYSAPISAGTSRDLAVYIMLALDANNSRLPRMPEQASSVKI